MAAKRRAGSQLTQDNWEEEDEVEVVEDGSFRIADNAVLSKRKIKKATRRLGASAAATNPSPFGAFKGFSSKAAAGPAEDKASFGSAFQVSSSKPSLGSAFQVSSSKPQLSIAPTLNFGATKPSNLPSSTAPSVETDSNSVNSPVIKPALNGGANTTNSNSNSEYSSKLKSLNLCVSSWIQQHVSKNPVCDLTPVFNDYRKHMAEIERKYGSERTNSNNAIGSQETESSTQKVSVVTSQSSLGTAQSGGFSFAAQSSGQTKEKKDEPKTTGLFGQGNSKITFGASGVTFGASAPSTVTSNTATGFSFLGGSAVQKNAEDKEERAPDAADEDEPPKPEVKVIEEKDALFSIRSKLYYKKDGQFKERGVGLLHLKKPGRTGQVLLRADTTLGNIIFNIGIPKALPVQRQGKNNVMLMAAMNPPPDKVCPQCSKKYIDPQSSNACESGCTPEPTAILLRVKTGDDADKLFEEINKLKE